MSITTSHRRWPALATLALVSTAALPALAAAQTNVALHKPAFASSTYCGTCGPEKAVDGVTNGDYSNPAGIFHSGSSSGNW